MACRLISAPALLAAGACMVFVSCSDAPGSARAAIGEWTAVVDTIADTIRVHTTAGRTWPSDGRLESELSIGVLDGAPEYQFGDVQAIAVAADGRMYVLDAHGPVVRMYARDGTHVRDVGREGGGPGEYKAPDSGLAVLPDGRVAVRDPGNGRITVYAEDGTYLDSWPIAGSMSTSNPMIVTRNGIVLTPVLRNLGTSEEWVRGLARYHPNAVVDTVDMPDLGFEEATISGESETSGREWIVPYSPRQHVAYSPLDYFVTGTSDEYRFILLRPDAPALEISMASEPVPVLADEADIERRRITQSFRSVFPGWTWNGPPIPGSKPAYRDIFIGEGGRIWVQVHVPSERVLSAAQQREEETRLDRPVNPYRESVAFDVFEPTGEYLGRVHAPEGIQTHPRPIIRDRTVWAVVTDELDVARLHRFKVIFE